ncbi:Alpha amylase, catalytic domain [Prevotella sp. khp1]|uniref:alpha-amylase family glycosyl hydrolase n=1 Tax=Prevotellaceae TaxID=171552 RepID=UPI000891F61E|nr:MULTISPECIES: alpha-amylase family glycosyl hydrolase [Prevotellaceae]QVJ79591.1 starch-binding protein [Xylanibacter ruminicola]SDQ34121.1 Alpha amylase, catalytic domain [Prevotella sp. khp1]
MRRFYSSLIFCFVVLTAMAQGWPKDYSGVMLQGFYWDSYNDSQWTRLEKQADDLSKVFDLVWIPQSGYCGGQSMGYDDLYWFNNYNSSFGTEEDLRKMIATFKEKGIGTIADVVINHRKNVSTWVDFPKETYKGETYEMFSTDICADDDDGATKTWADKNKYSLSANNDTGEGWGGMRDLDHKSTNVQRIVKAYLKMLLEDFGYTGFRYDMVKGYSGSYTKLYNEDSKPQFSVGECWDGTATIRNWIDATQKTSAAFDFQFRYTVRNAANASDWTKLGQQNDGNYPLISKNYEDASYSRYAVTFVENHDTEKRANAAQDPIKKDTLAANAYMLAMPGTPCVFLTHWKAYKQEIANMITVRKAVGITNTSAYANMASNKDYYAVQTTGTKGKLLVVVGTGAANYTPPTNGNWKKAISGYHYVYYVSDLDPATIVYPEINTEEEKDGEYAGVPAFCTMEEGERCAFFEAPISWGSQIFVWAWMNNGKGEDYLGTNWPGVSATKLGTADNGNSVWKWTVTGSVNPDNIIFSGGGMQTGNMNYTNGGYYFGKDGLKATVTATAIRHIDMTGQPAEHAVFDLQGRQVGTTKSSLKPGVYIINKQKFIVR